MKFVGYRPGVEIGISKKKKIAELFTVCQPVWMQVLR